MINAYKPLILAKISGHKLMYSIVKFLQPFLILDIYPIDLLQKEGSDKARVASTKTVSN